MDRTRCLYPGSFDPVTLGHVDVIRRAAQLFDEVVVAVMINKGKQGFFTIEERMDMIRRSCEQMPNVQVVSYHGLTVDLAREKDIHVLIRGVRGASDVENEMSMARANRQMAPEIETLLLPAAPERETVSSSLVKEIAGFGGDITAFVPPQVYRLIMERLSTSKEEIHHVQ